MEYIINYHDILIKSTKYEFIDPEEETNKLFGNILTQEEIIKNIIKNKLNNLVVCYDDKYKLKYIIENDNIKLSPLNPYSCHLIRLLGLKKINRYNLELDINLKIEYIGDILLDLNMMFDVDEKGIKLNPTDYCSLTANKLEVVGLDKISFLPDNILSIKSKHLVMDNRITDLYRKDPIVCEFLINILIVGSTHPKQEKIFNPLPQIMNINNIIEFKEVLNEEIKKNNININIIKEANNDIDLIRKIGSIAYSIINNAISDNFFSINSLNNYTQNIFDLLSSKKLKLTKSEDIFDTDSIKFINFNYSFEIENTFKKEYYLFHGTSLYSWYPIIKNGLKVMSGTEFEANGAAYGKGIYLSDSFSFSLGYSGYNNRNNLLYNSKNTKKQSDQIIDLDNWVQNINTKVVGVFEINDNIQNHKKTTNIFVVANEKILLLRYLILVEKNFTNYDDITDYFVKYLGSINKFNNKKSIDIKNKRLSSELKLLEANSNILNVEIINETTEWVIELKEIKQHKAKLQIYFNDYPKLPPKIILDMDIKKKIICDDNNKIILEDLNPANWNLTNNLSKLVDKICNCLLNSIN